jgi:hypothetical protein
MHTQTLHSMTRVVNLYDVIHALFLGYTLSYSNANHESLLVEEYGFCTEGVLPWRSKIAFPAYVRALDKMESTIWP